MGRLDSLIETEIKAQWLTVAAALSLTSTVPTVKVQVQDDNVHVPHSIHVFAEQNGQLLPMSAPKTLYRRIQDFTLTIYEKTPAALVISIKVLTYIIHNKSITDGEWMLTSFVETESDQIASIVFFGRERQGIRIGEW